MFAAFPKRSNLPGTVGHHISLNGAGTSVPTVQAKTGNGMSVARSGVGVLVITWADNPGTFVGFNYGFGAATATAVDGWTVVRSAFTAATSTADATLTLTIFSDTPAAADLATNSILDLTFIFRTVRA